MTDDWDWDDSGGGKAASYDGKPPISWEGEIVSIGSARPDTDMKGEVRKWDNGQEIMTRAISIQTDTRLDGEDDGVRGIYCAEGSRRKKALAEALKAAGVKAPEIGGFLKMTFTHEVPAKRGNFMAKEYTAIYRAPVNTSDPWAVDTGNGQQAAAQPAQAQQPAAGPDPNIAALINKGLDAAKVATMDPATRAMVLAQLG